MMAIPAITSLVSTAAQTAKDNKDLVQQTVLGGMSIKVCVDEYNKFCNWLNTRSEADKSKLRQLGGIFNKYCSRYKRINSFEEHILKLNVQYNMNSTEYDLVAGNRLGKVITLERINKITKFKQDILYISRPIYSNLYYSVVGFSKPSQELELPENLILEEMCNFLVDLTHKSDFTQDDLDCVSNRKEYIRQIILLNDISWRGNFVKYLNDPIYKILEEVYKKIEKEINVNKYRSVLSAIYNTGQQIINIYMQLLYHASGEDKRNIHILTPEYCLENANKISRSYYGKLLLCFINTDDFKACMPTLGSNQFSTHSFVIQFNENDFLEKKYYELFENMLSLLWFILACERYQRYREIAGNLLLAKNLSEDNGFNLKQCFEISKSLIENIIKEILAIYHQKHMSDLANDLDVRYFSKIKELLRKCNQYVVELSERVINGDDEEIKNLSQSQNEANLYVNKLVNYVKTLKRKSTSDLIGMFGVCAPQQSDKRPPAHTPDDRDTKRHRPNELKL